MNLFDYFRIKELRTIIYYFNIHIVLVGNTVTILRLNFIEILDIEIVKSIMAVDNTISVIICFDYMILHTEFGKTIVVFNYYMFPFEVFNNIMVADYSTMLDFKIKNNIANHTNRNEYKSQTLIILMLFI